MSKLYLGIDIGGTTARVAAYRDKHDLHEVGRTDFSVSRDFDTDFSNLVTAVQSVAWTGQLEGVGLAVAGKVGPTRNYLTGASNLAHWINYPVASRLSRELDCPVTLGNDAEAAAMAEALYGNGQGQNFWFVIWGTGIGGCQIKQIGGWPYPLPGEVGHQSIPSDGYLRCNCGQLNCLEAHIGGAGIERRFGKSASELRSFQWVTVTEEMARGLHNIITIQPTDLIVFGGGIATKQAQLLPTIEQELAKRLRIVSAPRIEPSAFGESAGTVGALALLDLV